MKTAVKNEYMRRFWIANQAEEIIKANYTALAETAHLLKKDGYPTKKLADRLDIRDRGNTTHQLEDGQDVNIVYVGLSAGYTFLELKIRARVQSSYFDYTVYLGRLEANKDNYGIGNLNNGNTELKDLSDILEQIEAYKPKLDLTAVYQQMDERADLLQKLDELEAKMPYYAKRC